VGAVVEAGDVIDNEHFGFGDEQGVFELVLEILLVTAELVHFVGLRVGYGAAKLATELIVVVVFGAVALLKLLVAELVINIEHAAWFGSELQRGDGPAIGNAIAYLYGEYGFAGVGIGKKDAKLALEPEAIEQHLRFGDPGAVAEPFAGTFDDEFGFGAPGFGFRVLKFPYGWFGPGLWFGLNATDGIADLFDHGGAFRQVMRDVGIIHEIEFGSLGQCSRTEQFRASGVFKYRQNGSFLQIFLAFFDVFERKYREKRVFLGDFEG